MCALFEHVCAIEVRITVFKLWLLIFSETNQLENPRQQWHVEQEQMLKDYLVTAQDDLEVHIRLHVCRALDKRVFDDN